jgi:hypothetical protein
MNREELKRHGLRGTTNIFNGFPSFLLSIRQLLEERYKRMVQAWQKAMNKKK